MNFETFRNICAALPGTCEKTPFAHLPNRYNQSIVCFCVGDKWFALVNCADFRFCDLKCDPARSIELQNQYEDIEPGWHMNKKHWITVRFGGDVPDETTARLVKDSYELVLASLPRKLREQVRAMPAGGTPPEPDWLPPRARRRQ